jgi:hypothetical protein
MEQLPRIGEKLHIGRLIATEFDKDAVVYLLRGFVANDRQDWIDGNDPTDNECQHDKTEQGQRDACQR